VLTEVSAMTVIDAVFYRRGTLTTSRGLLEAARHFHQWIAQG